MLKYMTLDDNNVMYSSI